MLSTLLELLGFAAFVAATYLLAGPVGALYTGGAAFLIVGYAVTDSPADTALSRASAPARARIGALRTRIRAARAKRKTKA